MTRIAKWTSCASTRSAPWRWTRCKRRTPATRERRWRWRRWSIACGSASCASIPAIRSGPIVTDSCFRPGTLRCCSTPLLHLTGVKAVNPKYETLGHLSVTLDDIKRFRQLDSKCPGHPEYRWTSGVETTTGPLGQGVATSVGMAIAGALDGGLLQSPGLRAFRLRRLRAVRRRLHDGRDLRTRPRRWPVT